MIPQETTCANVSATTRPLDSFFANLFQECLPSILLENVNLIEDQHHSYCSRQSPASFRACSRSHSSSSVDDRWDNTSSCKRDVGLSSPVSSRWESQEDIIDMASWASATVPPEKPTRTRDSLAFLKQVVSNSTSSSPGHTPMHKIALELSLERRTRKLPKALWELPYGSDYCLRGNGAAASLEFFETAN